MLLQVTTLVLILTKLAASQYPSPCPRIFSYETKHDNISNRWYGNVTLTSDKDLKGVWLYIALDRPANLLGNWFGQVTTCDNTVFLIRNPEYTLPADFPLKMKLFVNFDQSKQIPSLETVKLNGKVVCSVQNSQRRSIGPLGNSATIEDHTTKSNPAVPSVAVEEVQIVKPSEAPVYNSELTEQNDWIDLRSDLNPSNASNNETSDCGTVAVRVTPLISQGQGTMPGQWPWHAAVYYYEDIKITFQCGATLITERHVLTAAHCITVPRTKVVVNPSNILISLGKYNLNVFDEQLQDRGVSNLFVHPQYNHSNLFNDIAVVELSTSVRVTNYVRPCCLWNGDSNLNAVVGKIGTVVGWGLSEDKKFSHKLMQAKMPVVPTDECFYSSQEYRWYLHQSNYCAGFRNGTAVCNGDSGGAMVFPRKGPNGQPVWYIRGIVSSSLKPSQELCDTSHYNIFTDVAKHSKWIKEIINK